MTPALIDEQVRLVLQSLDDGDFLDDSPLASHSEIPIPDSLLEVDSNDVVGIAFPILKHMMAGQDSDEIWSIQRVLDEALNNNLGNGEPLEKICFAVMGLIGGLHEAGLIEIQGQETVIRNETKFFLDCNSAGAYEFLADLGEWAGEDPRLVERYRGDAQFYRYMSW